MKTLITAIIILHSFSSIMANENEKLLKNLFDKTIQITKHYYPNAKIERDKTELKISLNTQKFIIHRIGKIGEIREETYEQIGPNYNGFILSIALVPGIYQGSLVPNQELQRPYWNTYFTAVHTLDQKNYFYLSHSYGNRIKKEFRDKIKKTFDPVNNKSLIYWPFE